MEKQNDFTKGSVSGNIMRLAMPMMAAQLINVLYSVWTGSTSAICPTLQPSR